MVLENSSIIFNNDNSIVFLNPSRKNYLLYLSLYNNSICYIGVDNYFNGCLSIQCSEQKNVIIGDECLFSFGIWLRTSDVHLIYDMETKKRINTSKSILIGDHVWIGQDAKIWKGTHIGSGSVIGAGSFTAGKHIYSNSVWGGNPAKIIKNNTFFLGNCSHPFTDGESQRYSESHDSKYIYEFNAEETIDFNELEQKITSYASAQERLEFLIDFNAKKSKNRFYIGK